MTEREKMMAGELYNAMDDELVKIRRQCRLLVYEYNNSHPSDWEKRDKILYDLLGERGKYCFMELPIRFDYGVNVKIGNHFFSNFGLTVLDCCQVTIGDSVYFATNVSLLGAGHPIDAELRNAGPEYGMPITIGNNVWLGGGVIVCPGVTIGNDVVVGAGSVVTKDIPSGVVAVGNPCRVLRKITEKDREFYFKNRKTPQEVLDLIGRENIISE